MQSSELLDRQVGASYVADGAMALREFTAHNWAKASDNRIHADDVGQRYGFRGGLVPGVTSFAYVVEAAVDEMSTSWLGCGRISLRLLRPVYDGERVRASVQASGEPALMSLDEPEAGSSVSGRVGDGPIGSFPEIGRGEVRLDRPTASPKTLATGTLLGCLQHRFSSVRQQQYLDAIGIDEPRWMHDRVAHPGFLVRDANDALAENVLLGPWIHVGSDVSLVRAVEDGDLLDVRSVVRAEYERKGHRFVELDVVTLADGIPAMHVHHTAIYRPRAVS